MAYDPHLADRIRSILTSAGEFSEKKMFGGLSFMVNGHMCCGVLKTDLVLRLTPKEAAASLRQPHTRPMDFTGKPMKSMIYVNAAGVDSDRDLATWIETALRVAQRAPEKKLDRRTAKNRGAGSASSVARGSTNAKHPRAKRTKKR